MQLIFQLHSDLASLFLAQTLITSLITWLHLSSIFYCVYCVYKGDDNPTEAKLVQEMFNQLPGALFQIFLTFLQLSFCILFPRSLLCVRFLDFFRSQLPWKFDEHSWKWSCHNTLSPWRYEDIIVAISEWDNLLLSRILRFNPNLCCSLCPCIQL
jgi:hypothetical protein